LTVSPVLRFTNEVMTLLPPSDLAFTVLIAVMAHYRINLFLPSDLAFTVATAVMAHHRIGPKTVTFKRVVAYVESHCSEVPADEFFAQLKQALRLGLRSQKGGAALWHPPSK
jgi:hypothetical protein